MKSILGKFGSISVACVAGVVCARAAGPGPYIKAEVGPTFMEDTTLREFVGVSSGNKVEFNPGFRFAAGGGYSFNDFLAIGGETGFSFNSFDRISGNFFNEDDAGVGQVPLMGNIVLKLPTKIGLMPYVGAGAGVSFTFFAADDLVFDPTPGGISGDETFVDGEESDTVFSWQLFGGLKFAINEQMSVGVGYKYINTEGPRWDAEEDFFTGVNTDISMDRLESHSITFIFNMKF
jgi:opacity protein-like surface antigen